MFKIIPNILTDDIDLVEKQLKTLKALQITDLHLDIIDGQFVNNKTIGVDDFSKLKLAKYFNIYLHLMVNQPEKYLAGAKNINIKAFIVHIEKVANQIKFMEKVKKNKLPIGFALDGLTPIDKLNFSLLPHLDYILIMAIKSGWVGQPFIKKRLNDVKKLQKIKKNYQYHYTLVMDGGINLDTIKSCYRAGAEIVFVYSAFWKNKQLKKGLAELYQKAQN